MTQDEIMQLAIQAGASPDENKIWLMYAEEIEAFAKLVAAKEREALAQEQEPVAWPCLIAEADFSQDTVTLTMQCTDYKVSAGKHWLSTTPPQRTEQEPVAHWSDCAVHSEPAYPKGECDCGGIVAVADYTALSDKYVALSDKYVALKAQRTWQGLTDEDRQAAFESMPDMLDGFLKTWGWLHFSKAIEAKLKQKNGFAEENA